MRLPLVPALGALVVVLGLAHPRALQAQRAHAPFPQWQGELLQPAPPARLETRAHTETGLLVGALFGAAATGLFLFAFCGDPDTSCGADEVGRAVLVIAVPCAMVGALIGSLSRTEE
jgi:hypothetical protein